MALPLTQPSHHPHSPHMTLTPCLPASLTDGRTHTHTSIEKDVEKGKTRYLLTIDYSTIEMYCIYGSGSTVFPRRFKCKYASVP